MCYNNIFINYRKTGNHSSGYCQNYAEFCIRKRHYSLFLLINQTAVVSEIITSLTGDNIQGIASFDCSGPEVNVESRMLFWHSFFYYTSSKIKMQWPVNFRKILPLKDDIFKDELLF
jgi:hypothetical protein